ncbi:hypothetical protein K439DRAFT_894903 [Ramaria rubella]|nr:hypothetical protein K439DRAFT_894903 [Ramaria rubella]
MSLDSFLYSDEQLAGPSYDSHSLSPITPTDFSSHSLSPQPNFHTPFSQKTPTDIGPFDAKALHPRFCYPDCDTETTGKMAQFYCPRVRSVAYNDDFVISSCVRPGESGFESGEKETIFQVCPKVESSECHDILQCPIWSNIPHQEELTFPHPCPSLVNLSSFEAPIVPESPKAVQFVTPKFKGVDENCSQASLSPYAPMPLPPIFCLPVESQTSTQHLPLDSTLTCTRSPFWSGHTASLALN